MNEGSRFSVSNLCSLLGPAIAGAALLAAATPPFAAFPAAYVAFAVLLRKQSSPSAAAKAGFAFGFAYACLTMYWVVYVMVCYGGLPWAFAVLLLMALASYLAAYPALFAAAYARYSPDVPGWLRPLIFSAVWAVLEFGRARLLTGFPWMLLGYTQHSFLPMVQVSAFASIYGLGAIVMLVNLLLVEAFREGVSRRRIGYGASAVAVIAVLSTAGMVRMERLKSSSGNSRPLRVSVVQGNIDQSLKWEKGMQRDILRKYVSLTDRAIGSSTHPPSLVVWPETALPFMYGVEEDMTAFFRELMRGRGFQLLTGYVGYASDDGRTALTNSAGLFSDGMLRGRYDKVHLVPFGEYVPLQKLLFFVHRLVSAVGDFKAGEAPEAIVTEQGVRVGMLVCYESIFPEIADAYRKQDADILVNITNDAWFGNTPAPHQHLVMGMYRAVESGVWLVRAANSGISAIVTPWGEIVRSTELFRDAVISAEVRY